MSNVVVEVAENAIEPAMAGVDLCRPPYDLCHRHENTYCTVPRPGASIGVGGCELTGSVGGYVRMTFEDGTIQYCALASHHALSRMYISSYPFYELLCLLLYPRYLSREGCEHELN